MLNQVTHMPKFVQLQQFEAALGYTLLLIIDVVPCGRQPGDAAEMLLIFRTHDFLWQGLKQN